MNDNSKEAYNNIKPRIPLHGEMILSQLHKYPHGLSCEQIGNTCGLNEIQVVRRMSELERAGMVKRSDRKQSYKGSDGKTYHKQIWVAVNNEI
jgi:DNA-binding transcriptional regulator YhcF (GntR family)